MDNPNSYSYQTDMFNFGKQIGEYFFAILSQQSTAIRATDNETKDSSSNPNTQLTNPTEQSIISAD